jgi:hypothetical protein
MQQDYPPFVLDFIRAIPHEWLQLSKPLVPFSYWPPGPVSITKVLFLLRETASYVFTLNSPDIGSRHG